MYIESKRTYIYTSSEGIGCEKKTEEAKKRKVKGVTTRWKHNGMLKGIKRRWLAVANRAQNTVYTQRRDSLCG